MIKVENVQVWGFPAAVRGMRNPLNSWDKSDSGYGCATDKCNDCIAECNAAWSVYVIGDADMALMQKLYKGGTEHRKYLRQIFVSMDIVAPLYWYKEYDTYKVGTVANSCSTMHKIHAKEFTLDDFSHEHLTKYSLKALHNTIEVLNNNRESYLETDGETSYWWQLIQLLPSSYNQRRTVTMNYENVVNMIKQREHHKLTEWRSFVEELKKLPYIKQIMGLA